MVSTKYAFPWIVILSVWFTHTVDSKRTRFYDMPGPHCGNKIEEIDGVVIRSSRNPLYANHACRMRFMSDDSIFTSKQLMLILTRFNITDCRAKFQLYYNSDTAGGPAFTARCPSTPEYTRMVFYPIGKYLTILFEKDTINGYDFELAITTYKTGSHCSEFRCSNTRCIDKDLVCDGADNCFDGSDEICNHGHRPNMMVGPLVSLFVAAIGIVSCCACIFFCCRRHRASRGQVIRLQTTQTQQQQQPLQPVVATSMPPPSYYTAGDYPSAPQAYNAGQPAYPPPQGYSGQAQYPDPSQAYPGQPQYPQQPYPQPSYPGQQYPPPYQAPYPQQP